MSIEEALIDQNIRNDLTDEELDLGVEQVHSNQIMPSQQTMRSKSRGNPSQFYKA